MHNLAERIAESLTPGDVVFLEGPVGSGKTTFTQSLISTLSSEPLDVQSPTFAIVHDYSETTPPILHVDLYRLESREELAELGLEDYLDTHALVVEWASACRNNAIRPKVEIEITPADDLRYRHVKMLVWENPPSQQS